MPELIGVSKRFGEKTVLDSLSLRAPEDRVICLFGPSGCGKTTILRLMAGLLAQDSGRVLHVKTRCSFLFQEDRLLPWASALENLTAVGVPPQRAREALAQVGLAGEERALPASLSGGMRRRLAIARAAAYGGEYLFLDEPLRGLDEGTAQRALECLRGALRGRGGLLITHSPEEARLLADEIVVLEGPPVKIIKICKTAR